MVRIINDNSEASDVRVKLTCVQTLNVLCEDWNFMVAAFRPLAARAVGGMYALLEEIYGIEMMTLILETCRVIVLRMGDELGVEAANAVVAPLLGIWTRCADGKSILRKYVLSILTGIVDVVGCNEALQLYPVVMPMLDVSVCEGVDVSFYAWFCYFYVASFHGLRCARSLTHHLLKFNFFRSVD